MTAKIKIETIEKGLRLGQFLFVSVDYAKNIEVKQTGKSSEENRC